MKLTEKEIFEEIKIARTAALVALGLAFLNFCIIVFFSTMVLKWGVLH